MTKTIMQLKLFQKTQYMNVEYKNFYKYYRKFLEREISSLANKFSVYHEFYQVIIIIIINLRCFKDEHDIFFFQEYI